jgi:hypothetical protein
LSERPVEHVERRLGAAAPALKSAAELLEDSGFRDAAELIGTLALLGVGADLHAVGASVWLQLENMSDEERELAACALVDVARALAVKGSERERESVGELVDLLLQLQRIYPKEVAMAVNM